jgi:beta-glucosidase
MTRLSLPPGFALGAASAAFPTESAEGRGETIRDRFGDLPATLPETQGDPLGHLHEDAGRIADAGLTALRFGIAWARVQPGGAGRPRQDALDRYGRVVDGLLARGMTPHALLFEGDLPVEPDERGGFEDPDTAKRFAEYAHLVGGSLGDRVVHWHVLARPARHAWRGLARGREAPGRSDPAAAGRALLGMLRGGALACQALLEAHGNAQPGIAFDLRQVMPERDTEADAAAAVRVQAWLDAPLGLALDGAFPSVVEPEWVARTFGLRPGDEAMLKAPLAFVGVEPFPALRVRAAEGTGVAEAVLTNTAEGLDAGHLRERLAAVEAARAGVAQWVTLPGASGTATARVDTIRRSLDASLAARDAGARVEGLHVANLRDTRGRTGLHRDGLLAVDFDDGTRREREPCTWLGRVAREGGFDPEADGLEVA